MFTLCPHSTCLTLAATHLRLLNWPSLDGNRGHCQSGGLPSDSHGHPHVAKIPSHLSAGSFVAQLHSIGRKTNAIPGASAPLHLLCTISFSENVCPNHRLTSNFSSSFAIASCLLQSSRSFHSELFTTSERFEHISRAVPPKILSLHSNGLP